MADTNLEIGGLVSPDQLLNASETLAAQQRLLAREIFNAEPDVDDSFFADWSDFTARFLAWKSASSGWFSRVWTSTRDELVGFISEYGALRDRWATMHQETNAGGLKVTANDTLSGALDKAGTAVGGALKSIGIGLAVLVAVPLVGYVVWKMVRT